MGCADRFLNVRNDAGKSNANIPGGGSCDKSKMLTITYLTQDAKSFAFLEQTMFIHLRVSHEYSSSILNNKS